MNKYEEIKQAAADAAIEEELENMAKRLAEIAGQTGISITLDTTVCTNDVRVSSDFMARVGDNWYPLLPGAKYICTDEVGGMAGVLQKCRASIENIKGQEVE